MRKDIKKSSYYVWFLGAQEAKGLRGAKYINPVIRSLIEKEREVEPFKVTLQVSYKGLKIIQNLPNASSANSDKTGKNNRKSEIVKHFIPHHAVTCVLHDEDIVACILLLYNPVTKCPVHVHGYRCDSVETAAILSGQLQILIERPENQKKLSEIEVRLKAKGLLSSTPPPVRRLQKNPQVGSDTKSSSSRDSEFSRASSTERIAGLYDSLAAELREKLTGDPQPHSPILLPPRDYDTVHRQRGNLSGIDLRRCLSMNIVGMNVANNSRTHVGPKFDSSGASSGIGSDHAPSPDQDSDARFLDSHSTSDEEVITGLPLILEKSGQIDNKLALPKISRLNNFHLSPVPILGFRQGSKNLSDDNNSKVQPGIQQKIKSEDNLFFYKEHLKSRKDSEIVPQTQVVKRPEISHNKHPRPRKIPEERQRSPSPVNEKWLNGNSLTPRDRFNDAKEKFLWLERENLEQEKNQRQSDHKRPPQSMEPPLFTPFYNKSWSKSKASDYDADPEENQISEYFFGNEKDFKNVEEREHSKSGRHDIIYQKNHADDSNDLENFATRHDLEKLMTYSNHKDELSRVHSDPYDNTLHLPASITREGRMHDRYSGPRHEPVLDFMKREDKLNPIQNSPPPLPRMYSENAINEETTQQRVKQSKGLINSHSFTEDNTIPLERYRVPGRINEPLRPTSRQQYYPVFKSEQDETHHDYRQPNRPENHYYSSQNKFNNKNHFRSIHDSIQDEKKRNSNEIANEFKWRSYQAQASTNTAGYQEIDEFNRHPGLDRDTARVHNHQGHGESIASSPRYRHSYAEPFHHHQSQLPHTHDILHRNNSSVSTGRVGIAAIHPY